MKSYRNHLPYVGIFDANHIMSRNPLEAFRDFIERLEGLSFSATFKAKTILDCSLSGCIFPKSNHKINSQQKPKNLYLHYIQCIHLKTIRLLNIRLIF